MTLTDSNIDQQIITTDAVTRNVVQLLCVDYSELFLLPSYGLSRPKANYYASNLNLYFLVLTDLSMAKNYFMSIMNVEWEKTVMLFVH